MEKEEINKKIIEVIKKAEELGWIQKQVITKEPHMHLADVEKIIYGIFDESYINNLLKIKSNIEHDEWVRKQSEENAKRLNETQKDIPQKTPSVFIERAALCTVEGIRAICGTDEEYDEYVNKIKIQPQKERKK